jgi:condensin complex subunit 3
LYKLHVSLGKIVNSLAENGVKGRKSSAVMVEDKTVILGAEEESEEKIEIVKIEEEDDEGTVMGNPDETKLRRDSLVEDLLSDEDVTMS